MVKDAEANAESDKKQRALIEARNQAEGQLHNLRSDMKEVESQLTEEQKTAANEAFAKVEEAIKGNDTEAITKAVEDLFAAGMPIMQAKNNANSAQGSNQTTVDAEVTEVKEKAA